MAAMLEVSMTAPVLGRSEEISREDFLRDLSDKNKK